MLLFCFFFNVLVFWPWSMWDLTSPTRERTCTPALEGAVLIADSEGSSATVHFKVLAQEGSMELWLWSGQWGKRQLPGIRCMCQARTPLIYWLLPSHWINHYLNWWEELDSLVLYPKLLTPSFTHIIFLIKLTHHLTLLLPTSLSPHPQFGPCFGGREDEDFAIGLLFQSSDFSLWLLCNPSL